jgi:hypothetical protein
MNQLWSPGVVRDYWPRWTPPAIQNLDWLDASDCFKPKMFIGPNESRFNIAASGYEVITFAFIPGSWVWALSQVNSDSVDFQLTDTGANYKFFSSPVSASMISNSGGFFQPFYLPEPYLIVGPALLRLELWNNNTTATAASQLVLHVLEPREV